MNENLEIVILTKELLKTSLDENRFWKHENLAPMAKSKAIWLCSNSRISNNDCLGILAVEEGEMVGFLFMIPDFINTYGTNQKKVFWMIDWWVAPRYKETILGTYIYNQAVRLAGKQILIKGYTENVQDFYDKQPFKVIASRLRHTIFFSLDSSMLIGRFRFLKHIKFIIDFIDSIVAGSIRSLNKFKFKSRTKNLQYDYITQLDNETWTFLEPELKNDLIYKTKEYVNWQISNTQYLQTPISQKKLIINLQTGSSHNIHIHNIKIISKGLIIGFISYTINYNELNVKYFITKDASNYDLCVDALVEHLVIAKRNFIFTDDSRLSDAIAKRYTTLFRHKVIKKGLTHNETDFDFEKFNLLNRDGNFY